MFFYLRTQANLDMQAHSVIKDIYASKDFFTDIETKNINSDAFHAEIKSEHNCVLY